MFQVWSNDFDTYQDPKNHVAVTIYGESEGYVNVVSLPLMFMYARRIVCIPVKIEENQKKILLESTI